MDNGAVTTLIVLQSVGLALTLGGLGVAVFVAIKAKKEVQVMKNKYQRVKEEFRLFASRVQNIL